MQRLTPEHIEALLDATPDALLLVDEAGLIRYANRPAERLFACPCGGLLERPVESLLPAELAERHRHHRDRYLAAPTLRRMGERQVLEACRCDGRRIPVEVSLNPVRLDDRLFVLSMVREAGERLRRQRELERHVQQLAQRNAELATLGSLLAEWMQKPARQVRQYAELFQGRYGATLDAAGCECLEGLYHSARRMEAQLGALARYLRLGEEPLEPIPVDLTAVLAEVRRRLDYLLEDREASLQVEALPAVAGDPALLEELFLQLVDNAVRHGGEEPWVVVRCLETAGDQVVISVRDNGPGVPEALRAVLFEPFRRGPSRDEGLGMGLAIARRIAEVHGGGLWLEGAADFRVRLPRAP